MSIKPTLLIVDDDSRNIFALSAILKARGFLPLSATGMKEALAVLEANPHIAAVLMDMMMPGMDGYEAMGFLKSHPVFGTLPLFAVTAQAMAGDKERCLTAGADEYISKPVDIDVLVSFLKKHIK